MSVHRREVHAEAAWQTTGPELVDLRQEPCARDRGDGPVRRADAGVQAALWLHHRSARSSGASLDCRERNPTADWIGRQLTEAFPWDSAPAYLIRDRDRAFGPVVCQRMRAM